jgi:hypothetical protein
VGADKKSKIKKGSHKFGGEVRWRDKRKKDITLRQREDGGEKVKVKGYHTGYSHIPKKKYTPRGYPLCLLSLPPLPTEKIHHFKSDPLCLLSFRPKKIIHVLLRRFDPPPYYLFFHLIISTCLSFTPKKNPCATRTI